MSSPKGRPKPAAENLRVASLAAKGVESKPLVTRQQQELAKNSLPGTLAKKARQKARKTAAAEAEASKKSFAVQQDPDLIHANKALYLDNTVTQFRRQVSFVVW